MKTFPEWIPEAVVTQYENLTTEAPHYDQLDIDALHRCMESKSMEKAWASVNRRKKKCEPTRFASAILTVHLISRHLDSGAGPSLAKISTSKALSASARDLSRALAAFLDSLPSLHSTLWFADAPQESLSNLANRIDSYSLLITKRYEDLKNLSGQPHSKKFRLILMIRLLNSEMQSLYDTPLHNVVALTCNAVLGEYVNAEYVRNITRER